MTPEERAAAIVDYTVFDMDDDVDSVQREDMRREITEAIGAAIAEKHKPLLALLKEAEWAGRIWNDTPVCPWCFGLHPSEPPPAPGRLDDRGHRPLCPFVAATRGSV